MIEFDKNDPYPLMSEDSHSYAEAQQHSELVDAWLGLETARIETQIRRDVDSGDCHVASAQQYWIGLSTRSMLTPYTELRAMLARVIDRPEMTLVDLGAGYGRMGFVTGRHFPEARFVGYEVLERRVAEGNRALARFEYSGVELRCADLASDDMQPIEADLYFLYDYGSRAAIEKTLGDLRATSRKRPITVIGRGRASRDAIERRHPWLSAIVPPEHGPHYSIYRSQ